MPNNASVSRQLFSDSVLDFSSWQSTYIYVKSVFAPDDFAVQYSANK